jgi:hypothetical protein
VVDLYGNDSLMKQTEIKDSALNEFITSDNEVQITLDSIKLKMFRKISITSAAGNSPEKLRS